MQAIGQRWCTFTKVPHRIDEQIKALETLTVEGEAFGLKAFCKSFPVLDVS